MINSEYTPGYSMTWLIGSLKTGKNFDYVFFWTPTGKNGKLGQWYPCSFTVDGHTYSCTEQYMMAQKAILFGDEEIFQEILSTDDPKKMKALGRKIKNFDPALWGANKCRIVYEGNMAKFGQNPEFKKLLLDTGDKVLVEASPYDKIWGIGLKDYQAAKVHPSEWQGENLLGFALMQVRDSFREETSK